MLSRDEAEKRLKQFAIKNWDRERSAALSRLPGKLAAVGQGLLQRDPKGKPFRDWWKQYESREKAAQQMNDLSSAERQKIFAVLFPKIARHLEAAWQMYGRLPYEVDGDRKGFRAPNAPEVHVVARTSWLETVVDDLQGYDEDVTWFAAWAPYLAGGSGSDCLGILLAAAIDAGGPEGDAVFEVLRESGSNQHEIGGMGRHVTRALLVASRPDGWEFVEKMLLAAQRQEGLRQVILESIDEAHPEAFRRMLRLILDRDLIRFSATVRAVDVWFGLGWDSLTPRAVKEAVEKACRFLDDPQARAEALANDSGEGLYLALWSVAFEDAEKAIAPAAGLLSDPQVERRFVGAHFLGQLGLPGAQRELAHALADEDLRVALTALEGCERDRYGDEFEDEEGGKGAKQADEIDLFDHLVGLIGRMPARPTELEALVWPWMTRTASRADVADELVSNLGKRPVTAVLPYLSQMGPSGRMWLVQKLIESKKWDDATREALFTLAGDGSSWVREQALEGLKKCKVEPTDAQRLEGFLSRKNVSLRRGVLTLLKKQKTPEALASADRLLASKKAPQRLAGLELLRELVERKRAVAECRARAEAYRQQHHQLGEEEQLTVEAILDIERVVPKLEDALGLMGTMERSKAVPPKPRKVTFLTPATLACLAALDDILARNQETTVTIQSHEGPSEELLANVESYEFPSPQPGKSAEEDAKRLPLREVWEEWFANRPKKQRDRDGLELVRALVWCGFDSKTWQGVVREFRKEWGDYLENVSGGLSLPKLKHEDLVGEVVAWLIRLHPPAGGMDFLLDAVEASFAAVPQEVLSRVVDVSNWLKRKKDWRFNSPVGIWQQKLGQYTQLLPREWTPERRLRYWRLMHWRDEPVPGVARARPELEELLAGYRAGEANDADVLDQVLVSGEFEDLETLTRPRKPGDKPADAKLEALLDRCRERILEIELARGEMETAASRPALHLASLSGLDTLFRLLGAIGTKKFARSYFGEGKMNVLTHLVEVTYPAEGDTPEAFAERAKKAGLSRERLLEIAFVAPQWLEHVEHAVGWEGLREGVWWFLAHMPGGRRGTGGGGDDFDDFDFDDDDFDDEDGQAQSGEPDEWEQIIRERTPLTRAERHEGAVDVDWFGRVYPALGPKRWAELAEAAKYGCRDQSFKKARLLADVLLGKASKSELVASIRDRQLREPVRLLGLLPLAGGEKREKDLLSRYKVLQEYRRYAKRLSPMSRESAVRTAEIGLENLARTAGFPDPVRLEWAMEAREIADLAAGPISASHAGVTVTLALDENAQPQLSVRRGEKELKNIPTEARKNPKVAALAERKTDLRRQASRMRESLERAMCRGDVFSGAELRQLFAHPILRPLLERLVLLGEGIAGYAVADGRGLRHHSGKIEPIKDDEKLRLAHAHDLLTGGDWPAWQRECFASERVQPFKQVFRELYVVTEQEKKDGGVSHRYAGHQVNPSQAMALFGSRGWATRDGVAKTFHDIGLTAVVSFRSGAWTPLEMEGLTLEGIEFRGRGEYRPIPLADVPPRVFSEAMRDLDLVVSVAHLGGVDPEASASTVEMRAALLRETCSLLRIDNYRVEKSHVLVQGQLGKYSVHLGSAVVHRHPGGSLCIVPVHAQQRGRLFLPFADDDPRTAEVLSKILLLARDHEIQDPNILDQLR
jgi:hypothetical protein